MDTEVEQQVVGNGEEGLGEGPEGDQPMSFWEHIAELRRRLFRIVIGVVAGFTISWGFAAQIIEVLKQPLLRAWDKAEVLGEPDLMVLGIQDPLMNDVRVALMGGIFIALPVIFYQVWMFVSPGLYRHEKRFVIPFVCTSAAMFALGSAFAFRFVLPFGYQWLLEYGGTTYRVQLELGNYLKGTTRLLLTFGLVFEFPLLVAFLAKTGAITHLSLLKFWKGAVVIIFIVAGFLTPPEPVSQSLMAGPMILLFFLSVGVAYLINPGEAEVERKDDPAQDSLENEDLPPQN